jgi:hypothetical protein
MVSKGAEEKYSMEGQESDLVMVVSLQLEEA